MDKDDKNPSNSVEDDTWMLVDDSQRFGIPPIIISEENEENCIQVDENDNNKLNVHDDSDDDGSISVISESEVLKNSSANSDIEDKLVDLPRLILRPEVRKRLLDGSLQDTEDEIRYRAIAPPSTPHNNLMSIRRRSQRIDTTNAPEIPSSTSHFSWLAFALIGVSMTFLLGNFLELKDSIEAIGSQFEQRIINLESQITLQRSQIMRLKAQQSPIEQEEIEDGFSINEPSSPDLPNLSNFKNFEEKIHPPPTKKVWLGDGEEDHFVKILDKKFVLPDYCYFGNKDDLFNEYNDKICAEKQKKMDRKLSKDDKKYNEYFKEPPQERYSESDNLEQSQVEKRGAEGSGGKPKQFKKFKEFKEAKNYREGKKYKDSKKDLNSGENIVISGDELEETRQNTENKINNEKQIKNSENANQNTEDDANESENILNESLKDLETVDQEKTFQNARFDKEGYKYEKKEKRVKKIKPRNHQDQNQNQYQENNEKKPARENKKSRKNEDKENQSSKKYSREGSGSDSKDQKPNKRKSDTENSSKTRRNGTRQKLGSGEWHNKLMKSRDEIRDEIRKQKQSNWYLERASEREIQRVDLTSQHQVNVSEP